MVLAVELARAARAGAGRRARPPVELGTIASRLVRAKSASKTS